MHVHLPAFPFPPTPPSWYAGHMATFLNSLPNILATTTIVLEARDARLPLTSVNPAFEEALDRYWRHRTLEGKERLVVYTKRDLADPRYQKPLTDAFQKYAGQNITFADTNNAQDVKGLLKSLIDIAKKNADIQSPAQLLIVGMPNVGKSTLLNALRNAGVHKGKAFRTSATPGLTRKFTGQVKIHDDPDVYVSDSPGVMLPYLGKGTSGSEKGMKLAVTAGLKDNFYDTELLAAYLLHMLPTKSKMPFDIPHPYSMTDPGAVITPGDSSAFLAALAQRLGLLQKQGAPNVLSAAVYFLNWFRKGGAGPWTGDFEGVGGVSGVDEAVRSWAAEGKGALSGDESKNQEKKRQVAERKRKKQERWTRLFGLRAATVG